MANSRVTTWTEKTELSGSEILASDADGANKRIPTASFLHRVPGSGVNFAVNFAVNTINANEAYCAILAPADVSGPNNIGSQTAPLGRDNTNGTLYGSFTDVGYVAGTTDVSYGTIGAGYDNVVNQIAGYVASNHSMLAENAEGHGAIVGGSYHFIRAGRGTIVGGRDNRIGDTTDDTGLLGTIVGGQQNRILETQRFSAIVGGRENTLRGTGDYGAVVGGYQNTLSGSRSVAVGGDGCNDNGAIGVLMSGQDTLPLNSGTSGSRNAQILGQESLVEAGDAQAIRVIQHARTTDATLTTAYAPSHLYFSGSKTTAMNARIQVVAYNETDDESVSFTTDVDLYYDGTTWLVNGNASETSGVSWSEPRANGTVETTDLDPPNIGLSVGQLRLKFQGLAGKSIKWVALIDGVMTVVSA